MGSPAWEPRRFKTEGPRHKVTLAQGSWMFDTTCIEALWQAVMRTPSGRPRGAAFPVTGVSSEGAKNFMKNLNGLLPGPDLILIRLPACRTYRLATWLARG